MILLVSCQAAISDSSRDDVHLDELIAKAAKGSPNKLYQLGFDGGDGAWFALAALAEDAGYLELRREMQIRSTQFDGAPYAVLSLSNLLISDPYALRRPLKHIKRAEKRFGAGSALRSAKIAVLAAYQREKKLASEMSAFGGEPWEAPVLAAALRRERKNSAHSAQAERFVLHCPEPQALKHLVGALPGDFAPAYLSLLQARLSFSQGQDARALEDYQLWLDEAIQSEDNSHSEIPHSIFYEIGKAARRAGMGKPWAGILAASALKLSGSQRFAAWYVAGELFRINGDQAAALEAFTMAADSVSSGLERDRAMWQRLATILRGNQSTVDEAVSALNHSSERWARPERFTDLLQLFLHQRVYRGEWALLAGLFHEWKDYWPNDIRAEAAWILAFAVHEGRVSGSARRYLEIAVESSPLSWPGLRAAGILNYNLDGIIASSPGEAADPELSVDDQVLLLYLEWHLAERAADAVLSNPERYSSHTIRQVSFALFETDPRLSIRIAGYLTKRPDYRANRIDLLLRHPLPYAPMARDIAFENNLPPEIFLGLIRTESAWDRYAVSRSGAQGLAQFMPATWAEWVARLKLSGNPDPFDPDTNLRMSAAYLYWLFHRDWTFGWIDVLASYNAGGGRVRTWRRNRPHYGADLFAVSIPAEEPRNYISKVLSAATIYGYIHDNSAPRHLHQEWGLEMIAVD